MKHEETIGTDKETLDPFSKILLATSTINYMAATLNGLINDYRHIVPALERKQKETGEDVHVSVMKESLAGQREMMDELLSKLCVAIEHMGNYLDGHDIVCAIDERVYKAPLEILLHDMDETGNDYEDA